MHSFLKPCPTIRRDYKILVLPRNVLARLLEGTCRNHEQTDTVPASHYPLTAARDGSKDFIDAEVYWFVTTMFLVRPSFVLVTSPLAGRQMNDQEKPLLSLGRRVHGLLCRHHFCRLLMWHHPFGKYPEADMFEFGGRKSGEWVIRK